MVLEQRKQQSFLKKATNSGNISGQLSYNFINEDGDSVAVWDLRCSAGATEPTEYGGKPIGLGSTLINCDTGISKMFNGTEWKEI